VAPLAASPATRFVALLPDGRHVSLGDATPGPGTGARPASRRRATPTTIAVPGAHGIAVGPDRAVYVSAPSRHLVVRIGPGGVTAPVLGTGEAGFAGETGSARHSRIDTPYGLAFGPDGALYVADSGNGLIRRVDVAADLLDTVAGTATRTLTPGGRHLMASGTEPTGWSMISPGELVLNGPRAVAFDAGSRLLVADIGNHRVLRIALAGLAADLYPGPGAGEAYLLAGTGQQADSGDGGPAARARLRRPAGVLALPDGRVSSPTRVTGGCGPSRHPVRSPRWLVAATRRRPDRPCGCGPRRGSRRCLTARCSSRTRRLAVSRPCRWAPPGRPARPRARRPGPTVPGRRPPARPRWPRGRSAACSLPPARPAARSPSCSPTARRASSLFSRTDGVDNRGTLEHGTLEHGTVGAGSGQAVPFDEFDFRSSDYR
jgi:hypothetical protein